MIENTLNLFNQTETLEGAALQSEGSCQFINLIKNSYL